MTQIETLLIFTFTHTHNNLFGADFEGNKVMGENTLVRLVAQTSP